MRSSVAALIVVAVAGVAYAAEPEPGQLRAIIQAMPARHAWERCTASVVHRELSSDRATQAIAEKALVRCKAREDRLLAVLVGRIGREKART